MAHTGLPEEMQQKPLIFATQDDLDHLSTQEKQRYGDKLQVLGTCDPYTAQWAAENNFYFALQGSVSLET